MKIQTEWLIFRIWRVNQENYFKYEEFMVVKTTKLQKSLLKVPHGKH